MSRYHRNVIVLSRHCNARGVAALVFRFGNPAVLIVFNPAAGRRRASLLWRVLDLLVSHGVRLDVAETQQPGHAGRLAQEAARRGEALVVAAGGDGTIAEVAGGLIGSATSLGIIPLGTANVLARELGLSFAPKAVAATLAFSRTRKVWPGIAAAPSGRRLFVQMLGVGFDAQVVHELSPALKRGFGRGAYVMQTLRESCRYDFAPVSLRVDGAELQAASVVVSKGRLYGGPYLLAPDACSSEPGFSVTLFPHGGAGTALMQGAMLPLGLLARSAGVRHLRGQCIEFFGNTPMPVQADGDMAGHTPLAIENAAAPISVVVG